MTLSQEPAWVLVIGAGRRTSTYGGAVRGHRPSFETIYNFALSARSHHESGSCDELEAARQRGYAEAAIDRLRRPEHFVRCLRPRAARHLKVTRWTLGRHHRACVSR